MEWSWKDREKGGLGLRYEPGNWGDILKGEWLCCWLEHWPGQRVHYRDPFCGLEGYPLSQATRQRIELAPVPRYRSHVEAERLPSSAQLVRRQAERAGIVVQQHLSDRESDPMQSLQDGDFLLFDPYDFFENWRNWTPALLEWSRRADALIYLYNKSPRGVGQFRNYQALRQAFREAEPWVGRVAADGCVPRAWHEVWLVGPRPAGSALRSQLEQSTRELYHHVLAPGAFE